MTKLVGSPHCRFTNTRKRPPPQRLRSSRAVFTHLTFRSDVEDSKNRSAGLRSDTTDPDVVGLNFVRDGYLLHSGRPHRLWFSRLVDIRMEDVC